MNIIFEITDKAVKRIDVLACDKGMDKALFRVAVDGGGCSGFQYDFSFYYLSPLLYYLFLLLRQLILFGDGYQ